MVKSMTGFGKGEATIADKKIVVEIRTLNSKQLDLSLKMPSRFRSLDPQVRAAASAVLVRGKADVYVNVESSASAAPAVINRQVFSSYWDQLVEAASQKGVNVVSDSVNALMMASVMRLPEVVGVHADDVTEQESHALLEALSQALVHIDTFRASEGKILMEDILSRVAAIEAAVDQVVPFEQERIETIRKRMTDAIDKAGVAVDNNRLEQEMIFYFEKLDVTEEKVRLVNHCRYFAEVVESEQAPGRKLGFIAQEMGREINTLGSKANHSAIQRIVVGMKDELEKIKEQLLNIL